MVGAVEVIVILGFLYAVECFMKLAPRDVLLVQAVAASRYTLKWPFLYPGNGNWGWLFFNPFRPLAPPFCSPQATFVLAEDGLLLYPGDKPFLLHYKDCTGVLSKGGQVQIGPHFYLSPPTFTNADTAAREIAAMAALDPSKRRLWISAKIDKSLNTELLQERIDLFRSKTAKLRTVATANCLIAFVLFPTLVLIVGLRAAIIPAAILAILLSTATAALAARVWDQFYEDRPSAEKWMLIAKTILYPVSALRPVQHLSLPLLTEWHPVALAYHLCDRRTAKSFTRALWAGLLYPSSDSSPGHSTCAALREYRAMEIAALSRFLERHGVGIEELSRPPQPLDSSCKTYCPKCMMQYARLSGVCTDCGNIALRLMEPPTPPVRPNPGGKPE